MIHDLNKRKIKAAFENMSKDKEALSLTKLIAQCMERAYKRTINNGIQ
jgi:hypothetical protein